MATKENSSVTLTAEQVEQIHRTLDEINLGLVAAHALAADSLDHENAQWYMLGIENISKVSCRKLDTIAAMLGGPIFGNFAEEFEPASAPSSPT